MSSYHSDDSTEIRYNVREYHRSRSPGIRLPRAPSPHRGPGPHFIQTVTRDVRDPRPPVGYYHGHRPDERMTIVATRSRSRERRSPPAQPRVPAAPPAPQVVIHQPFVDQRRIADSSSSSSDESSRGSSRHRRRRHRRHHSHSRARSRSSSRGSHLDDAKDRWEVKRLQEQLEAIRKEAHRKDEQRQMERYNKEVAELAQARRELELRQRREEEELRNDRFRDEYELMHLKREIARIKREEDQLRIEKAREEKARLEKDSDELARLKRDQEARRQQKQREEEEEYRKYKAELERRIKEEEAEKSQKAREAEAKAKAALEELERIHAERKKKEEEERIRREIELKRLEEEKKAQEEAERKKKEAEEAIAAYKAKEAERLEKEKKEQEEREKEIQRVLQERLIASGLDEKAIEAIMKKEKIKPEKEEPNPDTTLARATYTRMSLRHVEIETLLDFKIDFERDPNDPSYVLIKRWVPEWEQEQLWQHTRRLREAREAHVVTSTSSSHRHDHVVMLEPTEHHRRHSHRRSGEFQWVREKPRSRSKSPGLLLYLAGGRPR
ncbi:hypothetical protein VTJ49DRAFT_183 [Mycothermus thermophilus]|uniref:Uncharacterized protein n=1 Tax=Humicola insolens TaxID=85995 RepID=A0ABR3VFV1_HUMIN